MNNETEKKVPCEIFTRVVGTCKNCGSSFERYRSHYKQVFCSKECREKYKEVNNKKVTRRCNYCGKEYMVFYSKITQHGCCSSECKKKHCRKMCDEKNEKVCANCGSVFYRTGKPKYKSFCSQECSKEYMKGIQSPFWKGGTELNTGYRMLKVNGKYELEHRVLMERHIGRKLEPGEVVHHKDGNRKNNLLNNLIIMEKREHDRYHTLKRHHG